MRKLSVWHHHFIQDFLPDLAGGFVEHHASVVLVIVIFALLLRTLLTIFGAEGGERASGIGALAHVFFFAGRHHHRSNKEQ